MTDEQLFAMYFAAICSGLGAHTVDHAVSSEDLDNLAQSADNLLKRHRARYPFKPVRPVSVFEQVFGK